MSMFLNPLEKNPPLQTGRTLCDVGTYAAVSISDSGLLKQWIHSQSFSQSSTLVNVDLLVCAVVRLKTILTVLPSEGAGSR